MVRPSIVRPPVQYYTCHHPQDVITVARPSSLPCSAPAPGSALAAAPLFILVSFRLPLPPSLSPSLGVVGRPRPPSRLSSSHIIPSRMQGGGSGGRLSLLMRAERASERARGDIEGTIAVPRRRRRPPRSPSFTPRWVDHLQRKRGKREREREGRLRCLDCTVVGHA